MEDKDCYKLVDCFIGREYIDKCMEACSNSENIGKVIEFAANARGVDNKKHSHQQRIPVNLLREFADRIKINEICFESIKSFDDLYKEIGRCKIKGIGHLAIYDTAIRIGAFLKLEPDKVYLHRGALEGAKRLLKKQFREGDVIEVNEFPIPIPDKLTAAQIEDFLCVCKDCFVKSSPCNISKCNTLSNNHKC